ncbi:sugar ABC transporter permease [Paenibacillus swuensis]|uniref:Sugar ABC transporter permease n=1 Tax=Paenibacillus swuensis TaxID=1178515 RepID=A0A172TPX8_9BACL|nr:sugar ABC transporter permease [Paenibacillus swuensis]
MSVPAPPVKKRGRLSRRNMWFAYLFISPMVIGYTLFLLFPIVTAFYMSFTNWSFTTELAFVGLDNYKRALTSDPVFWKTVGNTLYFSAGLVPLNILLALSLALVLKRNLPGIGLFRTAIFTPVVTSIVVWAIVWKYIFATDGGLMNQLLQVFGFDPIPWMYTTSLVMPIVIVISVLKNVGLNMIIFLAALQDVPALYYEAAKIDGAGRVRTFFNVTLPLITPSVFLTTIITVIGSLKIFGQIYIMTGGGPGTSTYVLVYYIYQQAFKLFEFGYASAIAFILFFFILLLTILQWQMKKRWVHYEE